MSNHSDFVTRSRQLAADAIRLSNNFSAMAAELRYGIASEGGLGAEDFVGENAHLTAEGVLALYQVLGSLLAPLTDEQKTLIYKIR